MTMQRLSSESVQLWLAVLLTCGEWTVAVYVLAHGDYLMAYLAITYYIRETKGGQHYHEIIVKALQSVHRRKAP